MSLFANLRAAWTADTRMFELFLSAASIWVASCFLRDRLLMSQSRFFDFLETLGLTEHQWAWLFFSTAVLKLGGLALLFFERAPPWSYGLRRIGSFSSGLIWAALGTSYVLASDTSPAGGTVLIMAATSVWIMIRGPSMRSGPL